MAGSFPDNRDWTSCRNYFMWVKAYSSLFIDDDDIVINDKQTTPHGLVKHKKNVW